VDWLIAWIQFSWWRGLVRITTLMLPWQITVVSCVGREICISQKAFSLYIFFHLFSCFRLKPQSYILRCSSSIFSQNFLLLGSLSSGLQRHQVSTDVVDHLQDKCCNSKDCSLNLQSENLWFKNLCMEFLFLSL
jgi:hypothetical protein